MYVQVNVHVQYTLSKYVQVHVLYMYTVHVSTTCRYANVYVHRSLKLIYQNKFVNNNYEQSPNIYRIIQDICTCI